MLVVDARPPTATTRSAVRLDPRCSPADTRSSSSSRWPPGRLPAAAPPPRASPWRSRLRASCSPTPTPRPHARRDPRLRRHRHPPARLLAQLRPAAERQAQAGRRLRGLGPGDLPRRHLGAARRAAPRRVVARDRVHLNLTGPVPRWATKSRKDNVTRPSPKEFQAWATAVGRRYGDAVATWSIWNEPNQPQFLKPQYRKASVLARPLPAALPGRRARAQEDGRQPRRHVPDRRDLAARQLEGRVPARLLPADAVPQQLLQEDEEVRRARRRRLRAPRLHDGEGPALRPRTTRAT